MTRSRLAHLPSLLWVGPMVLLGSAPPIAAQTPAARLTLVVAAGAAGQYDGGRDLGPAGLSAAAGVQVRARGAIAARLEAQGFAYPDQVAADVLGTGPMPAERVAALAALAIWEPRRASPAYVVAGVAGLWARVPPIRREGDDAAGAGVVGVGLRAGSWLALEGQYLQAVHALGATRAVLAARLQLRHSVGDLGTVTHVGRTRGIDSRRGRG